MVSDTNFSFHANLERGLEGIMRSDGVITTRLLDNDGQLGGFHGAAVSRSGGIAEMVSDTNIVDGLNALIERLVDLHPPKH